MHEYNEKERDRERECADKLAHTNAICFNGIRLIHWLQAILEEGPQYGRQDVGIEKNAGGGIGDQMEIIMPMVAVVGLLQIAGNVAANRNGKYLQGV